MDRVEHGIGDEGDAGLLRRCDGPAERIQIARRRRDQHRYSLVVEGQWQRVLVEAEKIVRAGACADRQFVRAGGIDTDQKSLCLQARARPLPTVETVFPAGSRDRSRRRRPQPASVPSPPAPRPTASAHRRFRRRCACRDAKGRAGRLPGRERPADRRSRRGRVQRERRNGSTDARCPRDSGRAG